MLKWGLMLLLSSPFIPRKCQYIPMPMQVTVHPKEAVVDIQGLSDVPLAL